jgi:hypothetical protein
VGWLGGSLSGNDTLLAEAGEHAALINRFRGGKAEHNAASLAQTLELPVEDLSAPLKVLTYMGFLEPVGANYEVPMLYREGQ